MKKITLNIVAILLVVTTYANADNRDSWLNDKNYIQGVLYLKGEKGASFIKRQITNCPYDRCRRANTDANNNLATSTFIVKKPDYKKAIKFLYLSSQNGNALASDQLVTFLKGRLPYKMKHQPKFVLNILKKDTGLTYPQYGKLIISTAVKGFYANGCSSSYFYGEVLEHGYLNTDKNISLANKAYSTAYKFCPKNSIYKMLSSQKIKNNKRR